MAVDVWLLAIGDWLWALSAPRYALVMLATYSADLSRPSIFNDATPASMSCGRTSIPARSCGLSRYLRSPSGTFWLSEINSYGIRHACAHSPRLAERPPSASLVRHWPEYATHRAPWTKTSSGRHAGRELAVGS